MAKLNLGHEDETAFQTWLLKTRASSGTAQKMGVAEIELLRRAWWSGVGEGFRRGLATAEREVEIIRLQHKRTEV